MVVEWRSRTNMINTRKGTTIKTTGTELDTTEVLVGLVGGVGRFTWFEWPGHFGLFGFLLDHVLRCSFDSCQRITPYPTASGCPRQDNKSLAS